MISAYPPMQPAPEHSNQSVPRIVVVEDSSSLQIVIHRVIRRMSDYYEIVVVADGLAAMAQFDEHPVALMITDYGLTPSMNGLQLTTAVKEISPGTPVILMTGYATSEMQVQARACQVDYFLPKPFDISDLEQLVQTALAGSSVSLSK